ERPLYTGFSISTCSLFNRPSLAEWCKDRTLARSPQTIPAYFLPKHRKTLGICGIFFKNQKLYLCSDKNNEKT
ncbi:hypothetical protein, partial [Sphingobacterium paludis]|uniref:hypothetical protein n=1 Tax=Sphingobacterium paludis TaxID=1476465 RepID=UPI001AAF24F1